jgi:hypothetical protein
VANHSTSEATPPRELLQIEEPGAHHDALDLAGVDLALDITDTGIFAAVSVGGNVELIRGEGGSLALIPSNPSSGTADLILAAARAATLRLNRFVEGIALVIPDDADKAQCLALTEAIDETGLGFTFLIERSVARAIGGGVARHGSGTYLVLRVAGPWVYTHRVEVWDGVARHFVTGRVALDNAPALLKAETNSEIAGLIAPSNDALGEAVAASLGLKLLRGFDAPELAVLGAALLAEDADE